MVLNVHRNHNSYQGRGDRGKGVWRWAEREMIYLSLHCHRQNDSCIKMGSDESHFNVSVGSEGQSPNTVSTNHNLSEEKGEPRRNRTEALLLTRLTPYRWAKPAHFLGILILMRTVSAIHRQDPVLDTASVDKEEALDVLGQREICVLKVSTVLLLTISY